MNCMIYLQLYLQDKFTPHVIHKAAVFLNPKQKSMTVLSKADQLEALDYIGDQMDMLPLNATVRGRQDPEPPAKRPCLLLASAFDDEDEPEAPVNEVTGYKSLVVSGKVNILTWWRDHSEEFPGLSRIARDILCVMATSAASERNFSTAGYVINERRTCLTSESVDSILLVNSYLKDF